MTQNNDTYSIQQTADVLGLSIKNVRQFISSGELPAEKDSKGVYRVTPGALESFRNYLASGGHEKRLEAIKQSFADASTENIEHTDLFSEKPDVTQEQTTELQWCDISPFWNKHTLSEMTFVDLFCGAGGLSKGLEMAGLQGICGLDFFKEACQTYNRNFSHPCINADITLRESKELFYETVRDQLAGRKLNIVAGGFPCQGFSMAGNRNIDDSRNVLYKELIQIVRTLSPDYVICENVKGLRTMLNGKVEKKIIRDFESIGYNMRVATLCAADYYVPQKRERVIFIGTRLDKPVFHPAPILKPENYITTGETIADLMTMEDNPEFNHVATRHSQKMVEKILATPEGSSLYEKYKESWKKCPWNEPSCTIKENHGGVNLHPKLPRVLTAREMARLQSFPDDFIFEGNKVKQLVQIGNAVPPLLGKAIGLAIRYSENDF